MGQLGRASVKKVGENGGSGWVDDEGRPILERVDLMEVFFANIHCRI